MKPENPFMFSQCIDSSNWPVPNKESLEVRACHMKLVISQLAKPNNSYIKSSFINHAGSSYMRT